MTFLTNLALVATLISTTLAHDFFVLRTTLPSGGAPLYVTSSPYFSLSASSAPTSFTYDSTSKTINSTTSSDILFLRPTHGTPQYYVKLGNPWEDSVPALTIWNGWSFEELDGQKYLSGAYLACGNAGDAIYNLYSGARGFDNCQTVKLEVLSTPHDDAPITTSIASNQTITHTASIPTSTQTETTSETSVPVHNSTTTSVWLGTGTTTFIHPSGTGGVVPVPTGTGGVVVPTPTQPAEEGPGETEAPPSDGAGASLKGNKAIVGVVGAIVMGVLML